MPRPGLLLAAGSSALVVLVLLVAPRPVWSVPGLDADVRPDQLQPLGWPAAIIQLAVVAGLVWPFRPYLAALRCLAAVRVSTRLLLGLTGLLALASLLIFPGFSSDLFAYAKVERLWVVYGDNPLVTPVSAHPDDWAGTWLNPHETRAQPYGPLWSVLTWPIVRLAGESVAGLLVGYKLLAALGYVACCLLIWASVAPARRQRALVLFAWSPLVLFTVLGKVHNDVLLALALLAMVCCRRRAHHALGLAAVVLGSLVKATGLAAAPALLLADWRRGGWRALVVTLAVGLAVLVAGYAPFWVGQATLLSIWQQTQQPVWSPASLLLVLTAWLPGGPYELAVRAALGLICAVGTVWLLGRRRDACAPEQVAGTSGWLLLLGLLCLTSAVYAHYLVPVVALAAVADDVRLERTVQWLSIGGLAVYALDLLGLALWPMWLASVGYRVVGSLVLLGSAGLALRPPPAGQTQADAGHQDEAARLDQRRALQATGQ